MARDPGVAIAFCCALLVLPGLPASANGDDFARWEKDIAAFEKADAETPPPKGGVLFVGSSSIKRWKLDDSFPGRHYINRGFGGSQLGDSVHFADRLVLKHEPKVVVVYAGDNDLAAGKSPEQVAEDFKAFAKAVHDKLDGTQIIYLSIKPSTARWKLVEKIKEANRTIESICHDDQRLVFVDVFQPMLGKDGMPRKDLLVEDGLHLNADGYAIWTAIVKQHLPPVKE